MNDVIEHAPSAPQSALALLDRAIDKGVSTEQLAQLMALQERWDAERARKAFIAARARFQELCPEITKDQTADMGTSKEGKVRPKYKYATLAHIIAEVKPALAQCDLTYRWEMDDQTNKGQIQVTCVLSHADGHSERNAMSAGLDDTGAKNQIQQRGSTITYLQRYTLIGALGIATANEDDDGRSSGALNIEQIMEHNAAVRVWFESIASIKQHIRDKILSAAVEAAAEIDNETRQVLWRAPTKGGIFTTEERAIMKSDEWEQARRAMFQAEQANVRPTEPPPAPAAAPEPEPRTVDFLELDGGSVAEPTMDGVSESVSRCKDVPAIMKVNAEFKALFPDATKADKEAFQRAVANRIRELSDTQPGDQI